MDLDLRLVRYFTAVVDHEGFGRAASALHVAQPSLSRQIQHLEHQIGARLFDRTPRGIRLTEAGREFLPYARTLLATAHRASLAVRAAPAGTIVIGHVGDLSVGEAVRELRRRHPGAIVRTRHLAWSDQDALPEHRVDALVTRLPLPLPQTQRQTQTNADLRVTKLYDEPLMAVLPPNHPLVGKENIDIADLAEEHLVRCSYTPTMWGTPNPAVAAPVRPGMDDSFDDKLELVAGGHSVAVLPAGDHRATSRDDVVTIPLTGVEPCQVVAATRADDHSPLVDAFHQVMAETPFASH
jgi:DNA-binding transcriptional LysR family regulator